MTKKIIKQIPVLTLRDMVVFPFVVTPLFVGRPKSIAALEVAMGSGKQILLVAQKNSKKEDPGVEDLYSCGTIATILQLLRLPDGTLKVLVEGGARARITQFQNTSLALWADVETIETLVDDALQISSLTKIVLTVAEEYIKLNKRVPVEIINLLMSIEEPERLCDTIATQLSIKLDDKQRLLEISELSNKLKAIIELLETEIARFKMEYEINSRVKKQIDKNQREFILNEQMKAIRKELGKEDGEDETEYKSEIVELRKKIEDSGMTKQAKEQAENELKKLKMMPPMSAEASVSRHYLNVLTQIPWKKKTKIKRELALAQKILDEEHYGLEKVKERIVEYLAVQNRVKKLKGPILCLVGPPGVGKTSLGRSMAHATGREFVRMSLGGMRDEAEIRGHRRTYVGSLPGKILQSLIKVGVKNPLFLLDEIDKMAMDFRGDPASALLEVLDPEQNDTFSDHYLEVDYDLSDVMFVTTANTPDIPPALYDRMEIIELSGYTEDEKIAIAKRHLLKKQFEANGLKQNELEIGDDTIRDIIRYYTAEAGVRSLERKISKICRKVVKNSAFLKDKTKKWMVTPEDLEGYLGVRQHRYGLAEEKDQVGQATGLAWTEVGGDLLTIEAATMPGKGEFIITGHLGDVMQESIKAAMTVVRSRAKFLGIPSEFFEKNDVHVHVPEGAIPKDGPSAGITMCVALVSKLTNIPVFANVAMTGEITLRGEVLPIGGLKEKLLAARRGGIVHVIIPEENKKDLKEISEVIHGLNIHPVRWIEDVLRLALQRQPEPLEEEVITQGVMTTSKKQKPSRPIEKTH